MTKGEIAKQYFLQGYNCAQSVMLAFCDDLGIDKQTVLMLTSPFGGGMGRLREVCGTLSGAYMVLGLKRGYNEPKDTQGKTQLYNEVQDFAAKFREDNGSIICRELLDLRIKDKDTPTPSERTQQYYQARPCPDLCSYAADMLDEFLKSKGTE